MADLKLAIDFVLLQEDATLRGVVTHTAGDPGGATRYGIAERWHPELTVTGFFDPARVPAHEALTIAEHIYAVQYAEPLLLAEIEDQQVANRLLSFAVNEGPGEAVKIFQRVLPALVPLFVLATPDGLLGPHTLWAINKADPGRLREAIAAAEAEFYRAWVAQQPTQRAHLLGGLLSRAQA
jgi:lysozyme family protein